MCVKSLGKFDDDKKRRKDIYKQDLKRMSIFRGSALSLHIHTTHIWVALYVVHISHMLYTSRIALERVCITACGK